ncbi:unnamed protein product [Brassica oleracea]|uniref:(rape) hypothetical protein n=1 Tax=Brassica napus TaxID=3708 RepID=A0A816QUI3_BRANA|nr:unnamed protein product [Brassica napus]
MEYEPPRDWWRVWENAAAVAFKNGRLRIEAPVRLSHAESWREGAVIHCKSGNVNGKKGNAPETHGTRNGTHGDVGKVDMCVVNPAPRNSGWKWGRGGCFSHHPIETLEQLLLLLVVLRLSVPFLISDKKEK